MSLEAITLAFYVKGLTPAQKAVLVALADHADSNGCRVYPSVKRLCTKTSYADRTVRRALSDLRDMGLIIVVKESSYHRQTVYRLDLPEMQSLSERPARDAGHDLPESTEDLPESTLRPARDAGKPSYNPQEPSNKPPYIPPQEYPDPETEDHHVEIRTAILTQVKETMWYENEPKFDSAAEALIDMGANEEQVKGFSLWWKNNGHYSGKPALKSFMQNYSEYLDSLTPSPNGQHAPAPNREGMILEDETGRYIIKGGRPERIDDNGPY